LEPAKRDVPKALALHAEFDALFRMNSNDDFPWPGAVIVIDIEHPPAEAARLVADRFDLLPPTLAG